MSAIIGASTTSHLLMSTSAGPKRPCRTQTHQACHGRKPPLAASAVGRPNSNRDEPAPPFSKSPISLKLSDDGHARSRFKPSYSRYIPFNGERLHRYGWVMHIHSIACAIRRACAEHGLERAMNKRGCRTVHRPSVARPKATGPETLAALSCNTPEIAGARKGVLSYGTQPERRQQNNLIPIR